jgi:rsbT co-antagonist protein RsbR
MDREMAELREVQAELTDEEIARRKEWMQFSADDVVRLAELNPLAEEYADVVIEALYDHFLSFQETKKFFADPKTLAYVKSQQRQYFIRLTEGDYGREYVTNRLKVGAVHQRIGLEVKWYLGAYNLYMRTIARKIFEAYPDDVGKALEIYFSLKKLAFLDIELVIDTYIQTIRQQQEAIRELSTPVLQLRDRLLILPIIGVLDSQRARQLTTQLLTSIRSSRAKVVVMDVTGVPTVDSQVANHLVQTVEASRLMGATTIVSGLSSEVAQTMVTLGFDLSKLTTVGDLQGGIEYADRLLGYKVVQLTE